MSGAHQGVFMNQRSFFVPAPPGQEAFTTSGVFTWVAPAGVASVSVVCVGGGEGSGDINGSFGAGGAGLGFKNNIPVDSGDSYTVRVGAAGVGFSGGVLKNSFFINTSTVRGGGGAVNSGGSFTGDGGGNGGGSGIGSPNGGGGGAGGYAGTGGRGGEAITNSFITAGSGGGGGGGGGASSPTGAGGGGGVSIFGQVSNGAAGTLTSGGGGGSGGSSGGSNAGAGGSFGGGGGGTASTGSGGVGGGGAVRIIWPGDERSFPSTRTANE